MKRCSSCWALNLTPAAAMMVWILSMTTFLSPTYQKCETNQIVFYLPETVRIHNWKFANLSSTTHERDFLSPTTLIFCTNQFYIPNNLRPTTFCLTRLTTFKIWQGGWGVLFPPVLNDFEMFMTSLFLVCDSCHRKVAMIFNKVTCRVNVGTAASA